MKKIAFMNQKGGVGKTTTAVSIGSLLATEHGKRVLLVDLDPQGNLSDHVGIDPNTTEKSVYNVLIDQMPADEAIQQRYGMDVLPANLDLSGAEVELVSMMSRELRLKNALDAVGDRYDYVILDCPPSLGLLTVSGLAFASEVIVPMQAEYLALRGLSQLVHTVKLVAGHLNPALEVSGVIFCMYDPRTLLAKGVRDEVENFFPGKVYAGGVRKNIRLAEAPSYGQPVNVYDPRCAGTEDYRTLVLEFLHRHGETVPEGYQPPEPVWREPPAESPAAGAPPPDSAPHAGVCAQRRTADNPPPSLRPLWQEGERV